MSRKQYNEVSQIQGFDIELNQENTRRIDRLVDNYEKSILNNLNEEYQRKTRWPDR